MRRCGLNLLYVLLICVIEGAMAVELLFPSSLLPLLLPLVSERYGKWGCSLRLQINGSISCHSSRIFLAQLDSCITTNSFLVEFVFYTHKLCCICFSKSFPEGLLHFACVMIPSTSEGCIWIPAAANTFSARCYEEYFFSFTLKLSGYIHLGLVKKLHGLTSGSRLLHVVVRREKSADNS